MCFNSVKPEVRLISFYRTVNLPRLHHEDQSVVLQKEVYIICHENEGVSSPRPLRLPYIRLQDLVFNLLPVFRHHWEIQTCIHGAFLA